MSERDKNALKEHIYQPKHGGKDHSGYETLMKYEVNYEREEAFCNGWDQALESEAVIDLVSAVNILIKAPEYSIEEAMAMANLIIARDAFEKAKQK